ncbi:uncharacterized protein N7484_005580 [Penicillium longicatenatum]|uniref:uncharacterized protein n=1 Tax=Penicillium longicatenatum TaxID=1561947 RepID=UPI002547BF61|nr:uncharacterized protein N7484_005580 [Penicillium longicatenatum]KAJ5643073.1 hypothetical protein N7484_005580 [Penicillium longicatenatum]
MNFHYGICRFGPTNPRAYDAHKKTSTECEVCKTDSCIEDMHFGNRFALIITEWGGLGCDFGMTDPLWTSHACHGGLDKINTDKSPHVL